MSKLTAKQELFVQEYIKDFNGTAAYRRAGYSSKSPEVEASKLLRNPKVKEAIDEAQKGLEKRVHITQERIIEQIAKMAFYDVRDFAELYTERVPIERDDGTIEEVERQYVRYNENFDGTIVGGLSKGKDGIKFEFPNREKMLELLGKYFSMWTDKMNVDQTLSNKDGNPLMIEYLSPEERRARIDELNRKRGNGANSTS